MLAYVFWHWPRPEIDVASYCTHLLDFHETLAAHHPDGFHSSRVFALSQLPWLHSATPVFEDWYLVDNFAALESLNTGAISGPSEGPHNLVAREAAGGTAGLYALRSGDPARSGANFATWFAKPDTIPYKQFYSLMDGVSAASDSDIWQRQMTLGPTKEFSLYSKSQVALPAGIEASSVNLKLLWPLKID